jgi:hypothetical protein
MRKKKMKAPSVVAPKRPTIAELEAILNSEEDAPFEILPNGEVRAVSQEEIAKRPKPITMRENLGGEYGKRSA